MHGRRLSSLPATGLQNPKRDASIALAASLPSTGGKDLAACPGLALLPNVGTRQGGSPTQLCLWEHREQCWKEMLLTAEQGNVSAFSFKEVPGEPQGHLQGAQYGVGRADSLGWACAADLGQAPGREGRREGTPGQC